MTRALTLNQMLDRGLIEVRAKYPRKNAKNPPPPIDPDQVQAALEMMLRPLITEPVEHGSLEAS